MHSSNTIPQRSQRDRDRFMRWMRDEREEKEEKKNVRCCQCNRVPGLWEISVACEAFIQLLDSWLKCFMLAQYSSRTFSSLVRSETFFSFFFSLVLCFDFWSIISVYQYLCLSICFRKNSVSHTHTQSVYSVNCAQWPNDVRSVCQRWRRCHCSR